jgi:hypothetical protein
MDLQRTRLHVVVVHVVARFNLAEFIDGHLDWTHLSVKRGNECRADCKQKKWQFHTGFIPYRPYAVKPIDFAMLQ